MIEKLQELIDKSNKIVVFTGAGVSTLSGIKDFRSKDGLYNMKYDYPPEEILSHHFFINNTDEFYKFYKDKLNCISKKPNIVHKYFKKLEDKDKLLGVVTQNIDGLDKKALVSNVYELHGTIYKNCCMDCSLEYDADYVFSSIGVPKCSCGGIIKPEVVLYEEGLDSNVIEGAIDIISKCDLLLVLGTSLLVYPAASFLRYFSGDNIVIINRDLTNYDGIATLCIHDDLGEVFKKLK